MCPRDSVTKLLAEPYVIPALRNRSRDSSSASRGDILHRILPTPRLVRSRALERCISAETPVPIPAYSPNPAQDFAVGVGSPLKFEFKAADLAVSEHGKPDENEGQVSGDAMAEKLQGIHLDEQIPLPVLSIDTSSSANSKTLADELQSISACSPASSDSAGGGIPLGAYLIENDPLSRAIPLSSPSPGTPLAHPADGGFRYEYDDVHPSAILHLPPSVLPFPSNNTAPFTNAVFPLPFALSPLPPPVGGEDVVFDSEEEKRILMRNLWNVL